MEEGDYSKNFDYMEETTPSFHRKMTNFNYEYPPRALIFTTCTDSYHRSQEGLFKEQNRPG